MPPNPGLLCCVRAPVRTSESVHLVYFGGRLLSMCISAASISPPPEPCSCTSRPFPPWPCHPWPPSPARTVSQTKGCLCPVSRGGRRCSRHHSFWDTWVHLGAERAPHSPEARFPVNLEAPPPREYTCPDPAPKTPPHCSPQGGGLPGEGSMPEQVNGSSDPY